MHSTLSSFRNTSHSKNVPICSIRQDKYFPQQSPKKPRQKLPTIYKHKFFDMPYLYDPFYNQFNENPQLGLQKTISQTKTRLDSYIQQQRKQMIMKTGRPSIDNPEWMKITLHHYKKSNFSPPQKDQLIEERNYDIINNKKKPLHWFRSKRQEDNYYKSMIKDQMSQSMQFRETKNNEQQIDKKMKSTLNWIEAYKKQVSPKIGAVEYRDYSIRKPLLKIGKTAIVNTYSPFQQF